MLRILTLFEHKGHNTSQYCQMFAFSPCIKLLKSKQMSPSADGVVPLHLLPYESELGDSVTLKSLVMYVFDMDKRPSVPKHWERLPQVFLRGCFLLWTCGFRVGLAPVMSFICHLPNVYNFQGSELQELLSDCWDFDPDARLTAQCVVDRLVSLRSCVSP